MKQVHIAFISFPHFPHVNPTLSIVSVLVRLGYRVTFATSEKFAPAIYELGAEVVHIPPFEPKEFFEKGAWDREDSNHPVFGLQMRTLDSIRSFYENNCPELIVYDFMAFAGRVLAHEMRVPAIQTCPTFAHQRHIFDQDADAQRLWLYWETRTGQFLSRFSLPNHSFIFNQEDLNIHFFPRVFQPNFEMFGDKYFFAGRCAGERPYQQTWRISDTNGRRLAFVATSTTYTQGPDYFRMCMDALTNLGWHVVLAMQNEQDILALGPLPPTVEVVRKVANVEVLPHADLIICQGGIVSVSEATYHGVPVIITSQGFEELEWQGEIFEKLGIAIHIKGPDTNLDNLRRSVARASNDSTILSRVQAAKGAVRESPGSEETANRIVSYLRQSCNK